MILVSLLGMSPTAAFPIMMGSCAFLMPVGGLRFIREGSYDSRTSVALTLGVIPGVLLAAYFVVSMPLYAMRWLVIAVVIYTSIHMLSQRPPKPIASTGKASWRLCSAWPDIVFQPVVSPVEMRYAIAYRRDQHSPVLVRSTRSCARSLATISDPRAHSAH